MQIVISVLAFAAIIHAYTYAKWLRKNGKAISAIGVVFLIILALGLRLYWLLKY